MKLEQRVPVFNRKVLLIPICLKLVWKVLVERLLMISQKVCVEPFL